MPPINCEAKVWWFCVSPEDKSPGTVVIDWPDGGKSVRCHIETLTEGKNVWYSEKDDRTFFRSNEDHSILCDQLLNNEILRRNVNKSFDNVKQHHRFDLASLQNIFFLKNRITLKN